MSGGMALRIEFPPALFTRELAAYYLQMSLSDIDALKAKGKLIAVGDTKRVKFRKDELDRYAASLTERGAEG